MGKMNHGPQFQVPPQGLPSAAAGHAGGYKPMCDRAKDLEVEQAMADMRFFTAQDGRLNIDNYFMSTDPVTPRRGRRTVCSPSEFILEKQDCVLYIRSNELSRKL